MPLRLWTHLYSSLEVGLRRKSKIRCRSSHGILAVIVLANLPSYIEGLTKESAITPSTKRSASRQQKRFQVENRIIFVSRRNLDQLRTSKLCCRLGIEDDFHLLANIGLAEKGLLASRTFHGRRQSAKRFCLACMFLDKN